MFNQIQYSLALRLGVFGILSVSGTYFVLTRQWVCLIPTVIGWLYAIWMLHKLYKRTDRKVSFMFDAIDNNDYALQFATDNCLSDDKLVNESLNRIIRILYQAKIEAVQKEKYYELIMNSVNTGIVVLDDACNIYQSNKEALQLLGLSVFTHVNQLARVDTKLQATVTHLLPGDKHQISFINERGTVNLSIRVSEMSLQEKHVRILVINNIDSEMNDKEIDSWIRLIRVLNHEIMNSVAPITSLSNTLLSIHTDANSEIRKGLEMIYTTSKSLISFVESYRKFTHIPTPEPSLFYVREFAERMINLANHQNKYPNITFNLHIDPADLIVHADEKLITQVVLNLLKNAMQAIGNKQPDGRIELNAYCKPDESVVIEISNNGPGIPPEEAEHIFIPFFTTKKGGSGIGLSVSRQIMRLSGGSITLKSNPATNKTSFVLTFP